MFFLLFFYSSLLTEKFKSDSRSDNAYKEQDETAGMSEIINKYLQDWVTGLKRDDVLSVSLLLHSMFVNDLGMPTRVSDGNTAGVLHVSDRIIREWRRHFFIMMGAFLIRYKEDTYERSVL